MKMQRCLTTCWGAVCWKCSSQVLTAHQITETELVKVVNQLSELQSADWWFLWWFCWTSVLPVAQLILGPFGDWWEIWTSLSLRQILLYTVGLAIEVHNGSALWSLSLWLRAVFIYERSENRANVRLVMKFWVLNSDRIKVIAFESPQE